MILLLSTADDIADAVTTPFEEWCFSMDLHPDESQSWPLYEASVGVETHTPAAS